MPDSFVYLDRWAAMWVKCATCGASKDVAWPDPYGPCPHIGVRYLSVWPRTVSP